jgi:hypothetical protein
LFVPACNVAKVTHRTLSAIIAKVLSTSSETVPARNHTTTNGGYVTANNTKDDLALQTNHAGDLADDDDDAHVSGREHMAEYNNKTNVVQQVLTTHVDHSKKLQRHNLFQNFFIIKNCRVHTIIDGGSCNNLVSTDFVTKIGLMTCAHTHPYDTCSHSYITRPLFY